MSIVLKTEIVNGVIKSVSFESHQTKVNKNIKTPVFRKLPKVKRKKTFPSSSTSTADGNRSCKTKQYSQPKLSYPSLGALAIKNSPNGNLRVPEICKFISYHFPYFKMTTHKWQNSVGSSLKTNFGYFVRIEDDYWTLKEKSKYTLSRDREMQRYYDANVLEIKNSMSDPDNWDLLQKGDLKFDFSDCIDIEEENSSVNTTHSRNPTQEADQSDHDYIYMNYDISDYDTEDHYSKNDELLQNQVISLKKDNNYASGIGIIHDEDYNIDIKEEWRDEQDFTYDENEDILAHFSEPNIQEATSLTFFQATSYEENRSQPTGTSKRSQAKMQNREYVRRRLESFSKSISSSGAVENGVESHSDDNSEFIHGDLLSEPVLQLPVSSKDPKNKKRTTRVVKEEKLRRKLLRMCFIDLRKEIPSIAKCKTAAKVNILRTSTSYIHWLQKEGERLAVNKALLKDKSDILKRKFYKLNRDLGF